MRNIEEKENEKKRNQHHSGNKLNKIWTYGPLLSTRNIEGVISIRLLLTCLHMAWLVRFLHGLMNNKLNKKTKFRTKNVNCAFRL